MPTDSPSVLPSSPASRGAFFVLEGVDGVGKTTVRPLVAEQLARLTGRPIVCVHEPGGTALGQAIRALLLDPAAEARSPVTDLLLFSTARRQLIDTVVAPAVAEGAIVLADRFALSTYVYQGAAGVPTATIDALTAVAVGAHRPDRTAVLLHDPATLARRLATRGGADRFEATTAQAIAARQGRYVAAAARDPRAALVTAVGTPRDVAQRVIETFRPVLVAGGLLRASAA